MQRFIVGVILLFIIIFSTFYFTNHMGLQVVVTRDYESPRATQTLGNMEVLNWWGHTVFTARTIEVPANGNLLHTGRFNLFLTTGNVILGKARQPVYGIYEDSSQNHFSFKFVNKDKLFTIRPATNVHVLDGSIGIGEYINVLPKGAVWMHDTIESHEAFMKVMDGKQTAKLLVRAYGDDTPKYTLPLPTISFSPMHWIWALIKWIL